LKLVYEDGFGAFSGVRAAFLKKFVPREVNPNFEVYDSVNGYNRFIAVKSSRIPDDEDLAAGRFGIDFNRAKPTLKEALQYGSELPRGYKWTGNIAFAALNREEFDKKCAVWDNFYSYIWGSTPQTIWVAPHSGNVNRTTDDIIAIPKLMIDTCSAGVAASCAFNDKNKVSRRVMMPVHVTGQLGALINLGDLGVVDREKMDIVAKKIEMKYHERVQVLADEFKQDFCDKTPRILEHIKANRGTLNPEELYKIRRDDGFTIELYIKCLRLYGQEIKEFTLSGFKEALHNLGRIDVPVISNNFLYTGLNVGKLLKLREKMEKGQMHSAVLIECARVYAQRQPELVSEMILDIKRELFN